MQPITDSDIAAVAALSGQNQAGAAKIALQKMLVNIAAQADAAGLTTNDIFSALSAGATSFADRSLYEALTVETMIGGSWTALVVQAAGFKQLFEWAKNAESWLVDLLSQISSLGVIGGVKAEAVKAWNGLLGYLGAGSGATAKQDGPDTVGAAFNIMTASAAPALSTISALMAVKNLPPATTVGGGKGGGGGGTTQSGSSSSSSSSGSSSSSSSGSSDAGPSGRKGRRDATAIGIRSQRNMLRVRK